MDSSPGPFCRGAVDVNSNTKATPPAVDPNQHHSCFCPSHQRGHQPGFSSSHQPGFRSYSSHQPCSRSPGHSASPLTTHLATQPFYPTILTLATSSPGHSDPPLSSHHSPGHSASPLPTPQPPYSGPRHPSPLGLPPPRRKMALMTRKKLLLRRKRTHRKRWSRASSTSFSGYDTHRGYGNPHCRSLPLPRTFPPPPSGRHHGLLLQPAPLDHPGSLHPPRLRHLLPWTTLLPHTLLATSLLLLAST